MLEDVPAQICEAKLWRVTDSYTLLNALAFGESPAKPLVSQDLTG